MLRLVFLSLCLFVCTSALARQQEMPDSIVRYDAEVVVRKDGALNITEHITFASHLPEFARSFLVYSQTTGQELSYRFDSALVNGQEARYTAEGNEYQQSIRIQPAQPVSGSGPTTFTLSYQVENAFIFNEDIPYLDYIISGTEIFHPIREAKARVIVPNDNTYKASGFIYKIARVRENISIEEKGDTIYFSSIRPLAANTGLQVRLQFRKGDISPPSFIRIWTDEFSHIGYAAWTITGFFVILLYYCMAWYLVGRDKVDKGKKASGHIPEGSSPGIAYFLRHRSHYHTKALLIDLLNLLSKQAIRITYHDKNIYLLDNEDDSRLNAFERFLYSNIPFNRNGAMLLDPSNRNTVITLKSKHQIAIEKQSERHYWKKNRGYIIGGIALHVIFLFQHLSYFYTEALSPTLKIFPIFIVAYAIAHGGWALHFILVPERGPLARISPPVLTLLGLVIFAYSLLAFQAFPEIPITNTLITACTVLLHGWFYLQMQAPTRKGRTLLEQTNALEAYLASSGPVGADTYKLLEYYAWATAVSDEAVFEENVLPQVKANEKIAEIDDSGHITYRAAFGGWLSQTILSKLNNSFEPADLGDTGMYDSFD